MINIRKIILLPILTVLALVWFFWGLSGVYETENNPVSFKARLKAELASGSIDYDQYALNVYYSLREPEKLPPRYKSGALFQPGERCATYLIRDVQKNWQRLSPKTRKIFSRLNKAPDLPDQIPSTHFVVHFYDTSTSANDYANACLDFAEEVWQYFHNDKSYPEPQTGQYHLYLVDLAPALVIMEPPITIRQPRPLI